MKKVTLGLVLVGVMAIIAGCRAHEKHGMDKGMMDKGMAEHKMMQPPMGGPGMEKGMAEHKMMPMGGPEMQKRMMMQNMPKPPMGGPEMDMLSAITRAEIEGIRQLPQDKRYDALSEMIERMEMRPAEKQQLIKAIMELSDAEQKTELLTAMISNENEFIAKERHFKREMMEKKLTGGMEEREEMKGHKEHGERGEHEGMGKHEEGEEHEGMCCHEKCCEHQGMGKHKEHGEHEGMCKHEEGEEHEGMCKHKERGEHEGMCEHEKGGKCPMKKERENDEEDED